MENNLKNHSAVHLKLTQLYKAVLLPSKKIYEKYYHLVQLLLLFSCFQTRAQTTGLNEKQDLKVCFVN